MPFLRGDAPLGFSPSSPGPNPAFGVNPNDTLLYCNNPEQLWPEDLGDEAVGLGGKYLLWSYVTGSCQAFFAHENVTGLPIGYGLQVVNPSNQAVTVTISNTGLGSGPFACWESFFDGSPGPFGWLGTRVVPPGGVLWLLRSDHAFPPGDVFNGVVRFTITGGHAYVLNFAYHDFRQIRGYATYSGFVKRMEPSGQREWRVYKGTALGFYLTVPMHVAVSDLLQKPLHWETHGCRTGDLPAMRSFRCPVGPPSQPGDTLEFGCGAGENLGNWGIQYGYDVTVQNDTAETATLKIGVLQTAPPSFVYAATPEGHGGHPVGVEGWCFYAVSLAPGEQRRVPYQVILCGGGNGGLGNVLAAE